MREKLRCVTLSTECLLSHKTLFIETIKGYDRSKVEFFSRFD